MIREEIVKDIIDKIGSVLSCEKPQRYVDFALASSFAHCTCNLTSDEVFGYALVDRVREKSNGIAMLLQDYDGTFPEKEKPPAGMLQNLLKDEAGKPFSLPFLFSNETTIESQPFNKEALLHYINASWEYLVKSSFQKEDREIFKERFTQLITTLRECATASSSTLEFISQARRKFLASAGISSFGVPESFVRELHVQKLEEDLEAGFPFWHMKLPESFRVKHQSNDRTYLFYARTDSGSLSPVKFFSNPERFEFQRNGQPESITAEESMNAMRKGVLIPTVSVLNYICLSPARKKPSTESKRRIHLGGQFMAGLNGYAHELVEVFNKVLGHDRVSLVCTGYDRSICVETKKSGTHIGFGSVYPQFGKQGIQNSLREGTPLTLSRGKIYHGS